MPQPMGHDVLEGDIVVDSKCSPSTVECVEPMAYRGDVKNAQDCLEGIPNMGVYNLGVRREL